MDEGTGRNIMEYNLPFNVRSTNSLSSSAHFHNKVPLPRREGYQKKLRAPFQHFCYFECLDLKAKASPTATKTSTAAMVNAIV